MPLIGLTEAAKLVGKDKSTVHRWLESGKLSCTIGENGERMIDPAELDRFTPPKSSKEPDAIALRNPSKLQRNSMQLTEAVAQLEAERSKNRMLEERLSDKDSMIADLRQDREHWREQAQSLRLLTDQRERSDRHQDTLETMQKRLDELQHQLAEQAVQPVPEPIQSPSRRWKWWPVGKRA